MIKIAPSILSADFGKLLEQVQLVENGGADLLHVDVMDGQFVPNLTLGPVIVASLKGKTNLPMHCHLMIKTPEQFFKAFEQAGATYISFHAEAVDSIQKTLDELKKTSCKLAIAINPDTPLQRIVEFLPQLDLVLVMAVFPGFAGQKFIPEVLGKVRELKKLKTENNYRYLIEIDGGINLQTAPLAIAAGAECLVAGSAVYGNPDPVSVIKALKQC
jgi:ribulose-phosphate 3-epimerase